VENDTKGDHSGTDDDRVDFDSEEDQNTFKGLWNNKTEVFEDFDISITNNQSKSKSQIPIEKYNLVDFND
jgi:hypothetical protein